MSAVTASQTKVTTAVRERSERGKPLLMVGWGNLARGCFCRPVCDAGGGHVSIIEAAAVSSGPLRNCLRRFT
jgi:hypothetical protein